MRSTPILLLCFAMVACGGGRDRDSTPDASTDAGSVPTDGGDRDAGPPAMCDCAAAGTGAVWARRFVGEGAQQGLGIAVDERDGIYVVGRNTGTTDLGGGPLTVEGDAQGIFLAHYDCAGGFRWNRYFPHSDGDGGISGVARDADGNLVIHGYAVGEVDFGGGPVPPAAGGNREIVVVKLDPDGAFLWAWRPGWGNAHDVAFTTTGDVVVAGQFSSSVDFGAGPVRSMAQNNAFVAALDATTGEPTWARPFAGTEITRASAIDRAPSGDFVVGGRGVLDLGGTLVDGDAWLLEVSASDGSATSSRALDPTSALEGVWDLRVTEDGGVVLIGRILGTVAFDAVTLTSVGETDLYVLKLAVDGTGAWGRTFGAPTSRNFPIEIREGPAGELGVVGSFGDMLRYEAMSLPSAGESDVYALRMDAAGALMSLDTFGGASDESGLALGFDGCGHLLLTGHTRSNPIDLGAGPVSGTEDGQVDMFLTKLAPP